MSDSNVIALHAGDAALMEEKEAAVRITAGVRAGDAAAETELVERYSHGLRYLLHRRLGDSERVRDLLQETLYIAVEKLRSTDLENPERLAGYLRGIAIRVAMNASRKQKREPSRLDEDMLANVPDAQPRPYEKLSADESAAAIRRLLDSMPVKRDRELLIRYFLKDQDKEEVCAALGLSSLHFNRVLFRAKARFRKIVEADTAVGNFQVPPKR